MPRLRRAASGPSRTPAEKHAGQGRGRQATPTAAPRRRICARSARPPATSAWHGRSAAPPKNWKRRLRPRASPLPKSAPRKRGRANARRPSPRKPDNFARVLREGEIVAVNAHGDVHRLDQRTTGDLRPEIEARLDGFAGIDRAGLLNVTDAKEAMREASRAAWKAERRAEREQARPPSFMESRILECAEQARTLGAFIERDHDGRRIFGAEALAASFAAARDPDGPRMSEAATVYGDEAFTARLQQAGIAIARVTAADVLAVDSLRREEELARLAAEATREARPLHHFAEVLTGDLAAVDERGDVHRINPDKLGSAAKQLAADLPSVTEARAAFAIDREKTTELWAERRAELAARADGPEATTTATADHGELHSATSIGERFLRGLGRRLGDLLEADSNFIAPAPPLTKVQAELKERADEERGEARADNAAHAERAEAQHSLIAEAQRQVAQQRDDADSAQRQARSRDESRGYERER